jgi:hypothetical protein
MSKTKRKIEFPRETLLVEIERHCAACERKNRIALTKREARDFVGFKCQFCEEWNDDLLRERDAPEWWEELKVTGLVGLRSPDWNEEIDDFDVADFDEAEKLNKILRRELRAAKEELNENDLTDDLQSETERLRMQRLLEIVRRRKREENIFEQN